MGCWNDIERGRGNHSSWPSSSGNDPRRYRDPDCCCCSPGECCCTMCIIFISLALVAGLVLFLKFGLQLF